MNETIKDLLFAIFVFPFTAGNVKHSSKCPDGTISSVVITLTWLATVSVLIQVQSSPNAGVALTSLGLVYFVLSFNLFLGLTGCSFIICLSKWRGIESVGRYRPAPEATKLRILFLWLFGAGTLVNCIIKAWRDIFCFDVDITLWQNGDIIYNACLCTFVIVETILLSFFVSYKFKHSAAVHCSMAVIVGANVSVWFHTYSSYQAYQIQTKNFNTTLLHNISACLEKSHAVDILNKASPVLTPMILQFALLSVNLVLEMWSPYKIWRPRTDPGIPERELSSISDTEGHTSTYIPYSRSGSSFSQSEDSSLLENITQTSRPIWMYLVWLISMLIMLPLPALSIVGVKIPNAKYHNILECYLAWYKAVMLLSVYYGLFCLKHYMTPVQTRKGFHPREALLFLTSFGVFQYHIYQSLAGLLSNQITANTILLEGCLSIPLDYIQLIFMVQANRFKPRENVQTSNSYCGSLVLMTVLCFGLWSVDSFIGLYYGPLQSEMTETFGETIWRTIKSTVYPVLVFYRFATFFTYYSLYKKYSVSYTSAI